jgi:DNA polymerase/3'-5' exonuclease PolX
MANRSIFQGSLFYFLPNPSNLTPLRLDILSHQLICHSALILADISSLRSLLKEKSPELSRLFIIVPCNYSSEDQLALLHTIHSTSRRAKLLAIQFHSADWISQCLKLKKIISGELKGENQQNFSSPDSQTSAKVKVEHELDRSAVLPAKKKLKLQPSETAGLPSNYGNYLIDFKGDSSGSRENLPPSPSAATSLRSGERSNSALSSHNSPQKSSTNLNSHLTQPLNEMEAVHSAMGDNWRSYAYRRAINILETWPKYVQTSQDVEELAQTKGIGSKTLEKIREILRSGTVKKLEFFKHDEHVQTIKKFVQIYAVGRVVAQKLYSLGYRTVEKLRQDADSGAPKLNFLTRQQRIGLKHWEDSQKRIPRAEAAEIIDYVQAKLEIILKGALMEGCGSYRRGKNSSNDVDIIVTHENFVDTEEGNSFREQSLQKLVELLQQPENLNSNNGDTLNIPLNNNNNNNNNNSNSNNKNDSKSDSNGHSQNNVFLSDLLHLSGLSTRHHQASLAAFVLLPSTRPHFSGVHRRLDLKFYLRRCYAFALLYFTGSDQFNRSLRYLAMAQGKTLSDHRLAEALRDNNKSNENRDFSGRIWVGNSVECSTEEEIFRQLGVEYVQPHDRNHYHNFHNKISEAEMKGFIKSEEAEEEQEQHQKVKQEDNPPQYTNIISNISEDSNDAVEEISP